MDKHIENLRKELADQTARSMLECSSIELDSGVRQMEEKDWKACALELEYMVLTNQIKCWPPTCQFQFISWRRK